MATKKTTPKIQRKQNEPIEVLRERSLEYLSNPDTDDMTRVGLAEHLGYTETKGLYLRFTPAELDALYAESLELRRRRYSRHLAKVDKGLLKSAGEGNPTSAKLCFQRYEGWTEKSTQDINVTGASLRALVDMLSPELGKQVDAEIRALKAD